VKKQIVYFLKGLPASGKSTWAKEKIEEDRHKGIITKRINKDDLRSMLDNSVHSKERENFVLSVRDEILYESLREGYNVIIDDTNFHSKHLLRITKMVEAFVESCEVDSNKKVSVEIVEKFFDTSLSECIERDSKRSNPVGRKVIMDMYNRHLKSTVLAEVQFDPNLPNCIIVDVDGTLALHGNRRSPFEYWKAMEDRVNKPIATLIRILASFEENHNSPLKVIIMTGRENLKRELSFEDHPLTPKTVEQLTDDWLFKNNIDFDDILIRAEGDQRSDYIIKKELYEENIKGKYNVLYVIDDRRQVIDMWRELGLTVLDVAGNDF